MIGITYVVLGLAFALFALRLLLGPTLADRVLSMNGMTVVGMVLLGINAMQSGRGSFLAVLVLLAVIGFVGTAMIARFLERRGR